MGRRNIRPPLAGGGPARSGELFRRGPFSDGLDHICGEKCRPTRAMGGESSRPPRLGAEPPPAGGRPASSGELLRRRPARTVRTIFAGIKRRPARDMGGESSRPPRLAAVPPPAGARPASPGDLLLPRPARTVRTIFAGKKRRPARDTGGESSRPPRLAAVPPPAGGRPASSGDLLRRRPARTVRTIFAGKKRRPARVVVLRSRRPLPFVAVPPPGAGLPSSLCSLLRRRA